MKTFLFILLFFLIGCDMELKKPPTSRIVGKDYITYVGMQYQIIEVDGIEYLTSSKGGIYPLSH